MKRKVIFLLVLTMILFTACSGKDKNAEKGKSNIYKNEYGKVTLCDYKNLEGEKIIYEVREEELEEEIKYYLSEYAETKKVKRPIKWGDCLTVSLIGTMNDEVMEEWTKDDGYEIQLGDGEYSDEFYKQLEGAKIGDTVDFQMKYGEDDNPYDMGEGVVDYSVTIHKAHIEIYPELTDQFLEETFGFESEEAMREYLKAVLLDTYEFNSRFQLREQLLEKAIEQSTIHKYSDELYKQAKKAVEDEWVSSMEWFGFTTIEEVYEGFGMTEEDLEEEVMDKVERTIIVQAICEKEDLELTEEEYGKALAQYVIDWEYESAEELLADYDEDTMRVQIQEDKVMDFLIENATITERIALDSEYE